MMCFKQQHLALLNAMLYLGIGQRCLKIFLSVLFENQKRGQI